MDKQIKRAVNKLWKISSTLHKDGDITSEQYNTVLGHIKGLEIDLLKFDEIYDAKHEKKEALAYT